MSPYTTPIAPTTSGIMPAGERTGAVAEVKIGSATPALRGGAVVGSARKADIELLQLAVEVGALEPRFLGDLAHVALLATEQLLEVDALEGLARLAERQLEEARRDLGRNHLVGRRRLAEQALHVVGRDLPAHDLHVRDH